MSVFGRGGGGGKRGVLWGCASRELKACKAREIKAVFHIDDNSAIKIAF